MGMCSKNVRLVTLTMTLTERGEFPAGLDGYATAATAKDSCAFSCRTEASVPLSKVYPVYLCPVYLLDQV